MATWENLVLDTRHTLRSLRRDAGFFAAAVLIIGLGIGANTAIFSVVDTVLFRPLPFRDAGRLVWIANQTGGDGGLSSVTSRVRTYQEWRRANRSFESMAAYFAFFDYGTYTLTGLGEPERLAGVDVSQDFLPFLGVKPEVGRNFNQEEAKWNGPRAAILTHGYWQRRFGSDPRIVGQTLRLNDKPTTVVGVLPASFDFSSVFTPGSPVDMLVPFPITQETDRWGNTLAVLGRLKPGVSAGKAQAEFDVLDEQLRRAHPDWGTFGARITELRDHLTGQFRRGLLILLGAVGAVLLIACTNLSNLMLARANSRRKEVAIRYALGATRWRLVRQTLTESLVLAALGAAAGLLLAWAGIRALASLQAMAIPLLHTVTLDRTALLFTALAALVTGILFGVAPAFQTSDMGGAEWLKDSGRGTSGGRRIAWTRGGLVVAEVALASVLLAGAGLLLRSFEQVLQVDVGFQPEHAASWRIDTGSRFHTDADTVAFYDRLVRAVEAVPGVESAGITDALPLSRDRSWGIVPRGRVYAKDQVPIAHPRLVDWRYLQTMRIPLIAGREFNEHDTATSTPVIIVNQMAAKQLWPNENPIGQVTNGNRVVVGVVGNVRHQSVESAGDLEMYFPITQIDNGSVELVVRSRIPMTSVAPSIRSALRSIDASLPTAHYQELSELVDRAVSPRRFTMMLLAGFAGAALLLAAIGIYGVISYAVGQRTQEIGIRMALGASPGQVRRRVMAQTLTLVSTGIAIGMAGALVVSRLMASLLFHLQPSDPATFGVVIAVLLAVALAAGYVPARRASRVDPLSALRTD
jgi:predicted permease